MNSEDLLVVNLSACGRLLAFEYSELTFLATGLTDVFAAKNNKTLRATLTHKRYAALTGEVQEKYAASLDVPLGTFLANLKSQGDRFYRCFLNPWGDCAFCQFRMSNPMHKSRKGLYLYRTGPDVVYIGRSYDPFGKRVDQGYGKIHPKNCFRDGQSTNCHLNSLIQLNQSAIAFHVCLLDDNALIERAERELIQRLQPLWNTALAR